MRPGTFFGPGAPAGSHSELLPDAVLGPAEPRHERPVRLCSETRKSPNIGRSGQPLWLVCGRRTHRQKEEKSHEKTVYCDRCLGCRSTSRRPSDPGHEFRGEEHNPRGDSNRTSFPALPPELCPPHAGPNSQLALQDRSQRARRVAILGGTAWNYFFTSNRFFGPRPCWLKRSWCFGLSVRDCSEGIRYSRHT